jgi:hypothetical protein
MRDSTQKPSTPNTDNLGPEIAVVEMGGEEDTRVRPLREVLRELREEAEKDPERQVPPPPKENGDPGAP